MKCRNTRFDRVLLALDVLQWLRRFVCRSGDSVEGCWLLGGKVQEPNMRARIHSFDIAFYVYT